MLGTRRECRPVKHGAEDALRSNHTSQSRVPCKMIKMLSRCEEVATSHEQREARDKACYVASIIRSCNVRPDVYKVSASDPESF